MAFAMGVFFSDIHIKNYLISFNNTKVARNDKDGKTRCPKGQRVFIRVHRGNPQMPKYAKQKPMNNAL